MGFLEIFQAIYSLDFTILVDVIMSNIFWVFAFYVGGYIFSEGKHALRNGIVYSMLVLTSMDLFGTIQFSMYTAVGLGTLYIARMPILTLLEKSKNLSHLIPIFWVLSFFASIAIVAFFVGG